MNFILDLKEPANKPKQNCKLQTKLSLNCSSLGKVKEMDLLVLITIVNLLADLFSEASCKQNKTKIMHSVFTLSFANIFYILLISKPVLPFIFPLLQMYI